MEPYRLIQSIFAHDGPIRSICLGITENEVITGCQSDSPHVKRWKLSADLLSITEELSPPLFHDHWVTALIALKPSPNNPSLLQQGCFISGCVDSKIRIFSSDNSLLTTLTNGHTKGVISFSWLHPPSTSSSSSSTVQLISGGWDGLAILWDLSSFQPLRTFGPHENGVHVLGLSTGLTIATTSTGESVNSRPDNYHLRFWNTQTGQLIGSPIKDHQGSIRSIQPLPGIDGFLTTSNDGSIMMRSIEGQVIETLVHPLQEDGGPAFILDCNALETESGMDFVSCGEDGSLIVWQGTEMLQSIPHPKTVWVVLGFHTNPPSNQGDFLTGGQDGILRVFSKRSDYQTNAEVLQASTDFIQEVQTMKAARHNGPSKEDLDKAPQWDLRGTIPGKSEHQIMVFNRNGSLIAAEWTQGAWVYVGDVQGPNNSNSIAKNDSGVINGVHYDHILPVEIETATGLQNLQLGYNDLENPFVAAQRFINENGIGQYYLQQIADWILQRSGGGDGGGGAPQPPQRQPSVRPSQPSRQSSHESTTSSSGGGGGSGALVLDRPPQSFPYLVDGIAIFNDLPNISKMILKLKEINDSLDNSAKIVENEFFILEKLLSTLEKTSYYHSSVIQVEEFLILNNIFMKWENNEIAKNSLFILYDILRLTMIHPNSIELLKNPRVLNSLIQLFTRTRDLLIHIKGKKETLPYQIHLTMIRFFVNLLKHELILSSVIMNEGSSLKGIFEGILIEFNDSFYFQPSTNKLIRLSMITFFHNLFTILYQNQNSSIILWINQFNTTNGSNQYLENVIRFIYSIILGQEKDNYLIVFRAFQILFTMMNYSGFLHFPTIKEWILQNCMKSTIGQKDQLTIARNYWKEKENNSELLTCYNELLKLC